MAAPVLQPQQCINHIANNLRLAVVPGGIPVIGSGHLRAIRNQIITYMDNNMPHMASICKLVLVCNKIDLHPMLLSKYISDYNYMPGDSRDVGRLSTGIKKQLEDVSNNNQVLNFIQLIDPTMTPADVNDRLDVNPITNRLDNILGFDAAINNNYNFFNNTYSCPINILLNNNFIRQLDILTSNKYTLYSNFNTWMNHMNIYINHLINNAEDHAQVLINNAYLHNIYCQSIFPGMAMHNMLNSYSGVARCIHRIFSNINENLHATINRIFAPPFDNTILQNLLLSPNDLAAAIPCIFSGHECNAIYAALPQTAGALPMSISFTNVIYTHLTLIAYNFIYQYTHMDTCVIINIGNVDIAMATPAQRDVLQIIDRSGNVILGVGAIGAIHALAVGTFYVPTLVNFLTIASINNDNTWYIKRNQMAWLRWCLFININITNNHAAVAIAGNPRGDTISKQNYNSIKLFMHYTLERIESHIDRYNAAGNDYKPLTQILNEVRIEIHSTPAANIPALCTRIHFNHGTNLFDRPRLLNMLIYNNDANNHMKKYSSVITRIYNNISGANNIECSHNSFIGLISISSIISSAHYISLQNGTIPIAPRVILHEPWKNTLGTIAGSPRSTGLTYTLTEAFNYMA
jgi:hypothetical protein